MVSSRGNIIEQLSRAKEFSINEGLLREPWESCDLLENEIDEDYFTDENTHLDEASIVTFGGKLYPKFGYALVLSGGSGSGKGFTRKNKIAIEAKIIDVDGLKELYVKGAKRGKFNDEKEGNYNFKNPEDVGILHQKVKQRGWKDKIEKDFYDSQYDESRRPNIIYDITGDDPKKLIKIGQSLKELGYKTSLVWVVTNRQEAFIRNQLRDRVVPQAVFHQIHNDINTALEPFLKSADAKYYDEAWIAFGSADSARDLTADQKKQLNDMGVVQLQKAGNKFIIPKDVEEKVAMILGPNEPDPENPQKYMHYDELEKLGSVSELDNMDIKDLAKVAKNLGIKDKELEKYYSKKTGTSDRDGLFELISGYSEKELQKAIGILDVRKGIFKILK